MSQHRFKALLAWTFPFNSLSLTPSFLLIRFPYHPARLIFTLSLTPSFLRLTFRKEPSVCVWERESRKESDHLCFITLAMHLIHQRLSERKIWTAQLNIGCFKQLLSEIQRRDFNAVQQNPEQFPWHFCIHLPSFDTSFMPWEQCHSPCVCSGVTELNLINCCFDVTWLWVVLILSSQTLFFLHSNYFIIIILNNKHNDKNINDFH